MLILTFTAAHLAEAATFRWTLPLVSVLSTVVVCVAVHPGAPTMRRVLSAPWLVAVGRRSYGLYLWHFPVILVVYERGTALLPPDTTHIGFRLVVIGLLSLALASLSYRFVEVPARDYGRRLSRRLAARHRAATGASAPAAVPPVTPAPETPPPGTSAGATAGAGTTHDAKETRTP